jgi:hypothetical protein
MKRSFFILIRLEDFSCLFEVVDLSGRIRRCDVEQRVGRLSEHNPFATTCWHGWKIKGSKKGIWGWE